MRPAALTSPRERGALRQLRPLYPLLWEQRGRLALGVVLLLVITALSVSAPLVVRAMLHEVNQPWSQLITWLFWVASGVLLYAGAMWGAPLVLRQMGDAVVVKLKEQVFAHLLRLSPAFYDQQQSGELLSRLSEDAFTLYRGLSTDVPTSAVGALTMVLGGVLAFWLNPTLTAWLLLGALLTFIFMGWLGRTLRRLTRQQQQMVAEQSAFAQERLATMKTVQAYAQEARVASTYAQLHQKFLAQRWRYNCTFGAMIAAAALLQYGAYVLVLGVGLWQMQQGQLLLPDLIAYFVYVAIIGSSFQQVAHLLPFLQTAAGATERLFEILETPLTITNPTRPRSLPSAKGGRAVGFKGVEFAYPSRPERLVTQGLNLTVPANARVALVGPSGAGKTTVFQLLMRAYDPQRGQITLDGVPVKQLRLDDLRAQFALVSQDPVIFATSVLENIRFGRTNATQAQVETAAKAAFAHDFISKLPKGYQTLVGERGVMLSGGERQRVAIARAILCDPKVLLLDEATSSLDSHAEAMVQKALDRLMVGRTTLVIAHRLSTVQDADLIVVLDGGRVVAQGTHKQLLKSCALYRVLAARQLRD